VSFLGIGVFLAFQLLGRRRPSQSSQPLPTQPMHDEAMEREAEVVEAAGAELEERRAELEEVVEETDPDIRSESLTDLLNRRR